MLGLAGIRTKMLPSRLCTKGTLLRRWPRGRGDSWERCPCCQGCSTRISSRSTFADSIYYFRVKEMIKRDFYKILCPLVLQFIGACLEPVMVVVTELLVGGSLRKYLVNLRPRSLEPRVAVGFALDIARAMECLHAHGIIHRDLKPGNTCPCVIWSSCALYIIHCLLLIDFCKLWIIPFLFTMFTVHVSLFLL